MSDLVSRTPVPLAVLDPQLAEDTTRRRKKRLAASTQKAYASDWSRFAEHCARLGRPMLPADEDSILSHLNDLAREGLQLGSIRRAYATIRAMHTHAGHRLPTLDGVQNTLEHLALELGARPRKAAALTVEDLRRVVPLLPDTLAGVRDRAILLLGFAAALRRAEVVALEVRDVAIGDRGADVFLGRSKTDQIGEGVAVAVNRARGALCPVAAVEAWIARADLSEGRLFRPVNRWGQIALRMHDQHVDRLCKTAARLIGKDPSKYSGHSLRAGLATSAADAGKTLPEIMATTRHESEKVALGYIRHANRFKEAANRGLLDDET